MDSLWTVCESAYFPRNLRVRSTNTRHQYRYAINDYTAFLGHTATIADLDDDLFAPFLPWLVDVRGLCEITANERAGRIKSLWTWLAKRGVVPRFPTVGRLQVPESAPVAWSRDELHELFEAAGRMPGFVGPFKAYIWWERLLIWLWSTGERIGATFAMQWEHLDLERGVASLPAKIRKGSRKPAVYHLSADTCAMLARLKRPDSVYVFPWPKSEATYYLHWNRLLKMAELPIGRNRKSHSIRVSFATHTEAAGGDASRRLMHSDPATTRRHYLDLRFLPDSGADLFRLG
jgi:integrase